MITATDKIVVKKLIAALVYKHGVYIKDNYGFQINGNHEEKRIYDDFIGGIITVKDIKDDIAEYDRMMNHGI